jgi:two-component system, chemotaxis family, chemotaxis protein CheY
MHALKILVADDDPACRELLRDLLAAETDEPVVFANEGAEAWWALTAPGAHFDLAIFDIRMPGIDGISLLERIRATPALHDLPVIMCTGVRDRNTVIKVSGLSVTQYVTKPYRAQELRERVHEVSLARSVVDA